MRARDVEKTVKAEFPEHANDDVLFAEDGPRDERGRKQWWFGIRREGSGDKMIEVGSGYVDGAGAIEGLY